MENTRHLLAHGKEEKVQLTIYSHARDKIKYPDPHEYAIELNKTLKNVIGVTVVEATVPRTEYTVDGHNNEVVLLVSGAERRFRIPPGEYTHETLVNTLNETFVSLRLRLSASFTDRGRQNLILRGREPFRYDVLESSASRLLGFHLDSKSEYVGPNEPFHHGEGPIAWWWESFPTQLESTISPEGGTEMFQVADDESRFFAVGMPTNTHVYTVPWRGRRPDPSQTNRIRLPHAHTFAVLPTGHEIASSFGTVSVFRRVNVSDGAVRNGAKFEETYRVPDEVVRTAGTADPDVLDEGTGGTCRRFYSLRRTLADSFSDDPAHELALYVTQGAKYIGRETYGSIGTNVPDGMVVGGFDFVGGFRVPETFRWDEGEGEDTVVATVLLDVGDPTSLSTYRFLRWNPERTETESEDHAEGRVDLVLENTSLYAEYTVRDEEPSQITLPLSLFDDTETSLVETVRFIPLTPRSESFLGRGRAPFVHAHGDGTERHLVVFTDDRDVTKIRTTVHILDPGILNPGKYVYEPVPDADVITGAARWTRAFQSPEGNDTWYAWALGTDHTFGWMRLEDGTPTSLPLPTSSAVESVGLDMHASQGTWWIGALQTTEGEPGPVHVYHTADANAWTERELADENGDPFTSRSVSISSAPSPRTTDPSSVLALTDDREGGDGRIRVFRWDEGWTPLDRFPTVSDERADWIVMAGNVAVHGADAEGILRFRQWTDEVEWAPIFKPVEVQGQVRAVDAQVGADRLVRAVFADGSGVHMVRNLDDEFQQIRVADHQPAFLSLAFTSVGNTYVATQNANGQAVVLENDGGTAWVPTGGKTFLSDGGASHTAIGVTTQDVPVVGFINEIKDNTVSVQRFINGQWTEWFDTMANLVVNDVPSECVHSRADPERPWFAFRSRETGRVRVFRKLASTWYEMGVLDDFVEHSPSQLRMVSDAQGNMFLSFLDVASDSGIDNRLVILRFRPEDDDEPTATWKLLPHDDYPTEMKGHVVEHDLVWTDAGPNDTEKALIVSFVVRDREDSDEDPSQQGFVDIVRYRPNETNKWTKLFNNSGWTKTGPVKVSLFFGQKENASDTTFLTAFQSTERGIETFYSEREGVDYMWKPFPIVDIKLPVSRLGIMFAKASAEKANEVYLFWVTTDGSVHARSYNEERETWEVYAESDELHVGEQTVDTPTSLEGTVYPIPGDDGGWGRILARSKNWSFHNTGPAADLRPRFSDEEERVNNFKVFTDEGLVLSHDPSNNRLRIRFRLYEPVPNPDEETRPVRFTGMRFYMQPVNGGIKNFQLHVERGGQRPLDNVIVTPRTNPYEFKFTNVGENATYEVILTGFQSGDPSYRYRVHFYYNAPHVDDRAERAYFYPSPERVPRLVYLDGGLKIYEYGELPYNIPGVEGYGVRGHHEIDTLLNNPIRWDPVPLNQAYDPSKPPRWLLFRVAREEEDPELVLFSVTHNTDGTSTVSKAHRGPPPTDANIVGPIKYALGFFPEHEDQPLLWATYTSLIEVNTVAEIPQANYNLRAQVIETMPEPDIDEPWSWFEEVIEVTSFNHYDTFADSFDSTAALNTSEIRTSRLNPTSNISSAGTGTFLPSTTPTTTPNPNERGFSWDENHGGPFSAICVSDANDGVFVAFNHQDYSPPFFAMENKKTGFQVLNVGTVAPTYIDRPDGAIIEDSDDAYKHFAFFPTGDGEDTFFITSQYRYENQDIYGLGLWTLTDTTIEGVYRVDLVFVPGDEQGEELNKYKWRRVPVEDEPNTFQIQHDETENFIFAGGPNETQLLYAASLQFIEENTEIQIPDAPLPGEVTEEEEENGTTDDEEENGTIDGEGENGTVQPKTFFPGLPFMDELLLISGVEPLKFPTHFVISEAVPERSEIRLRCFGLGIPMIPGSQFREWQVTDEENTDSYPSADQGPGLRNNPGKVLDENEALTMSPISLTTANNINTLGNTQWLTDKLEARRRVCLQCLVRDTEQQTTNLLIIDASADTTPLDDDGSADTTPDIINRPWQRFAQPLLNLPQHLRTTNLQIRSIVRGEETPDHLVVFLPTENRQQFQGYELETTMAWFAPEDGVAYGRAKGSWVEPEDLLWSPSDVPVRFMDYYGTGDGSRFFVSVDRNKVVEAQRGITSRVFRSGWTLVESESEDPLTERFSHTHLITDPEFSVAFSDVEASGFPALAIRDGNGKWRLDESTTDAIENVSIMDTVVHKPDGTVRFAYTVRSATENGKRDLYVRKYERGLWIHESKFRVRSDGSIRFLPVTTADIRSIRLTVGPKDACIYLAFIVREGEGDDAKMVIRISKCPSETKEWTPLPGVETIDTESFHLSWDDEERLLLGFLRARYDEDPRACVLRYDSENDTWMEVYDRRITAPNNDNVHVVSTAIQPVPFASNSSTGDGSEGEDESANGTVDYPKLRPPGPPVFVGYRHVVESSEDDEDEGIRSTFARVMEYDGVDWTVLTQDEGVPVDNATDRPGIVSFAFTLARLYVACREPTRFGDPLSGKATVWEYTRGDKQGTWTALGGRGISHGTVDHVSVSVTGDETVYVAFREIGIHGTVNIRRWERFEDGSGHWVVDGYDETWDWHTLHLRNPPDPQIQPNPEVWEDVPVRPIDGRVVVQMDVPEDADTDPFEANAFEYKNKYEVWVPLVFPHGIHEKHDGYWFRTRVFLPRNCFRARIGLRLTVLVDDLRRPGVITHVDERVFLAGDLMPLVGLDLSLLLYEHEPDDDVFASAFRDRAWDRVFVEYDGVAFVCLEPTENPTGSADPESSTGVVRTWVAGPDYATVVGAYSTSQVSVHVRTPDGEPIPESEHGTVEPYRVRFLQGVDAYGGPVDVNGSNEWYGVDFLAFDRWTELNERLDTRSETEALFLVGTGLSPVRLYTAGDFWTDSGFLAYEVAETTTIHHPLPFFARPERVSPRNDVRFKLSLIVENKDRYLYRSDLGVLGWTPLRQHAEDFKYVNGRLVSAKDGKEYRLRNGDELVASASDQHARVTFAWELYQEDGVRLRTETVVPRFLGPRGTLVDELEDDTAFKPLFPFTYPKSLREAEDPVPITFRTRDYFANGLFYLDNDSDDDRPLDVTLRIPVFHPLFDALLDPVDIRRRGSLLSGAFTYDVVGFSQQRAVVTTALNAFSTYRLIWKSQRTGTEDRSAIRHVVNLVDGSETQFVMTVSNVDGCTFEIPVAGEEIVPFRAEPNTRFVPSVIRDLAFAVVPIDPPVNDASLLVGMFHRSPPGSSGLLEGHTITARWTVPETSVARGVVLYGNGLSVNTMVLTVKVDGVVIPTLPAPRTESTLHLEFSFRRDDEGGMVVLDGGTEVKVEIDPSPTATLHHAVLACVPHAETNTGEMLIAHVEDLREYTTHIVACYPEGRAIVVDGIETSLRNFEAGYEFMMADTNGVWEISNDERIQNALDVRGKLYAVTYETDVNASEFIDVQFVERNLIHMYQKQLQTNKVEKYVFSKSIEDKTPVQATLVPRTPVTSEFVRRVDQTLHLPGAMDDRYLRDLYLVCASSTPIPNGWIRVRLYANDDKLDEYAVIFNEDVPDPRIEFLTNVSIPAYPGSWSAIHVSYDRFLTGKVVFLRSANKYRVQFDFGTPLDSIEEEVPMVYSVQVPVHETDVGFRGEITFESCLTRAGFVPVYASTEGVTTELVSPGLTSLTPESFIKLSVPELERNSYVPENPEQKTKGIMTFFLKETLKHQNFQHDMNARYRLANPISSLSRLTLRFLREDDELYNFRGMDHSILFEFVYVVPRDALDFESPLLNSKFPEGSIPPHMLYGSGTDPTYRVRPWFREDVLNSLRDGLPGSVPNPLAEVPGTDGLESRMVEYPARGDQSMFPHRPEEDVDVDHDDEPSMDPPDPTARRPADPVPKD